MSYEALDDWSGLAFRWAQQERHAALAAKRMERFLERWRETGESWEDQQARARRRGKAQQMAGQK